MVTWQSSSSCRKENRCTMASDGNNPIRSTNPALIRAVPEPHGLDVTHGWAKESSSPDHFAELMESFCTKRKRAHSFASCIDPPVFLLLPFHFSPHFAGKEQARARFGLNYSFGLVQSRTPNSLLDRLNTSASPSCKGADAFDLPLHPLPLYPFNFFFETQLSPANTTNSTLLMHM